MHNYCRNVVITGASSGIGLATTLGLLRNGYYVYAHVRQESDKELFATNLMKKWGQRLSLLVCDFDCTRSVVKWIKEELGRIPVDVLINNAGVGIKKPFEEINLDEWEYIFRVNVTASFLLSQWAFQSMKSRQLKGLIIQIASMASLPDAEKFSGFVAYTASKSAVAGLSENLAREGRPYGIRAISISPGAVNTKMLNKMLPDCSEWMEPDEVSSFLVKLINSDSIKGTNIKLDKDDYTL